MRSIALFLICFAQLLSQTTAAATYYLGDRLQAVVGNHTEASLPHLLYTRGFGSSPAEERIELLPWKLIVNPSDNGTCSSVSLKLGLFVVVNVIAAAGVLILSSKVVASLTCGFLGGEKGFSPWRYTRDGLIGAILTLAANAVNAFLLHRAGTPDTILRLTVLFAFRPRISVTNIMAGLWLGDNYRFGGKSATIQEMVMATVSFAAACMALAYGAPRGNLHFDRHDTPAAIDAHIMYAGALSYAIAYPVIIGLLFMTLSESLGSTMGTIVMITFSSAALVGQWLFWAGLVRLASDL